MSINIISKLCNECIKCPFKNKCNHKRLVACAMLEIPKLNMTDLICSNGMSIVSPIKTKIDLRNIKLDKQTTITIDLNDIKKQIESDFYKQCKFLER